MARLTDRQEQVLLTLVYELVQEDASQLYGCQEVLVVTVGT